MKITRRRFVQTVGASLVLNPINLYASHNKPKAELSPFKHGVASGDPLHDRVILWTRVTPNSRTTGVIQVKWRIASDAGFETIINEGSIFTAAEIDFTVKIDTTDLQPATTYYYQFEALGHESPIGRTKTLPVDHVDHLRIAFTSCSNYPFGYFNVYQMIAQRNDLGCGVALRGLHLRVRQRHLW
ncbi:MAG: PhoD-like phosphatase N-terminal domain-containing protein [Woeseiaceae bacterium]